jgi:hypothetical protein
MGSRAHHNTHNPKRENMKSKEIAASLLFNNWTYDQPEIFENKYGFQIRFNWPSPVAEIQDFEDLQRDYNPESLFIEAVGDGQLVFIMGWPNPHE